MPMSQRSHYVLCWLLAIGTAASYLYFSWHHFDDPQRRDGSRGHTFVDFGGQYLLGRMLIAGQGRHLYDRSSQREVLQNVYPRENENPRQETTDVDMLLFRLIGKEDPPANDVYVIGGPIFPPIQAFWHYPVANLSPQAAYRTLQVLIV